MSRSALNSANQCRERRTAWSNHAPTCRAGGEGAADTMSILIFVVGAGLLIYSAEKLITYLVGAAARLRISVVLLAIIFTGIEFDDVALGVALNLEDLSGVALGTVFGTAISMSGVVL